MIDESNNYQLGLDFLYRQKLRQFFIFQKTFSKTNDWWITGITGDFFIIIIASSLSKLMRIPAWSVVNTLLKARIFINFDHIIINLICGYHPVEGSKMVRIFAGSVVNTLLKAQKMMRILAFSVVTTLLKARIFIYHPSSGFLSNNK